MKLTRKFSPVTIELETEEDLHYLMKMVAEVAFRHRFLPTSEDLQERARLFYKRLENLNAS